MKYTYRPKKNLTVEFEASGDLDAIKALATIDEVHGITQCGACDSDHLVYVHRSNKKNHRFPELKCMDCFSRLAFGQHSEGGGSLFPRRNYHDQHHMVKAGKAKADDRIPNGGWEKWHGDEE